MTAAVPAVLRSVPGVAQVLTPEALGFLAALQARFGQRLHALDHVARLALDDRNRRASRRDKTPPSASRNGWSGNRNLP